MHGAIEPAHLVIALCRLTDATAQEATQAEQRSSQQLRAEFDTLGITPQQFRRRLRAIIPTGGQADAADRLKAAIAQGVGTKGGVPGILSGSACSSAAQAMIQQAAALAGPATLPAARHLLRALLIGAMNSSSSTMPDGIPDRL